MIMVLQSVGLPAEAIAILLPIDRLLDTVRTVVNVQGDEPFTSKEGLEQVLSVFQGPDSDKIDLASLMTEIHDWKEISDPNCVKVIVDKDNFALYFSWALVAPRKSSSIIPDKFYPYFTGESSIACFF